METIGDMGLFKEKCRAFEAYGRYIGKDVVIYYNDIRGDSRILYGRIVEISADVIHITNPQTGWCGCIDTETCKVGQISMQEGWSK